jgi:hypothetical protein
LGYDRWASEVVDYSRLKNCVPSPSGVKIIFEFDYSVENKFGVCLKCQEKFSSLTKMSEIIFEFNQGLKNVVDYIRPQLTPVGSTPADGRSSRAHDFEKFPRNVCVCCPGQPASHRHHQNVLTSENKRFAIADSVV